MRVHGVWLSFLLAVVSAASGQPQQAAQAPNQAPQATLATTATTRASTTPAQNAPTTTSRQRPEQLELERAAVVAAEETVTDPREHDLCIVSEDQGWKVNVTWLVRDCNMPCRCVFRSEPLDQFTDIMRYPTLNSKPGSEPTEIRCGLPKLCAALLENFAPTPECPEPRLRMPETHPTKCDCPEIYCEKPANGTSPPTTISSSTLAATTTTTTTASVPAEPPKTTTLQAASAQRASSLVPATLASTSSTASAAATATSATAAANSNATSVTSSVTAGATRPATTSSPPQSQQASSGRPLGCRSRVANKLLAPGETFNDECHSICRCSPEGEIRCEPLVCPSEPPNDHLCLQWAPADPNFKPNSSESKCCPEFVCKLPVPLSVDSPPSSPPLSASSPTTTTSTGPSQPEMGTEHLVVVEGDPAATTTAPQGKSCKIMGRQIEHGERVPEVIQGGVTVDTSSSGIDGVAGDSAASDESCKKICTCQDGKIVCQPACPPLSELPPSDLECPASLAYQLTEECCPRWACQIPDEYALQEIVVNIVNATTVETLIVLPELALGRRGRLELNYTSLPLDNTDSLNDEPPPNATWIQRSSIRTYDGVFSSRQIKYHWIDLKPSFKYWFKVLVRFEDLAADKPPFDTPIGSSIQAFMTPPLVVTPSAGTPSDADEEELDRSSKISAVHSIVKPTSEGSPQTAPTTTTTQLTSTSTTSATSPSSTRASTSPPPTRIIQLVPSTRKSTRPPPTVESPTVASATTTASTTTQPPTTTTSTTTTTTTTTTNPPITSTSTRAPTQRQEKSQFSHAKEPSPGVTKPGAQTHHKVRFEESSPGRQTPIDRLSPSIGQGSHQTPMMPPLLLTPPPSPVLPNRLPSENQEDDQELERPSRISTFHSRPNSSRVSPATTTTQQQQQHTTSTTTTSTSTLPPPTRIIQIIPSTRGSSRPTQTTVSPTTASASTTARSTSTTSTISNQSIIQQQEKSIDTQGGEQIITKPGVQNHKEQGSTTPCGNSLDDPSPMRSSGELVASSWTEAIHLRVQNNVQIQRYAWHLLGALSVMTILFAIVSYLYFKKSSRVIAPITSPYGHHHSLHHQSAYDNPSFTTKLVSYNANQPRVLVIDESYQNLDNLAKQKNMEVDKSSPLHYHHNKNNMKNCHNNNSNNTNNNNNGNHVHTTTTPIQHQNGRQHLI